VRFRLIPCLALFCVFGACRAWCQCSVAATSLAFGNYQPLSGVADRSTATITVSCSSASGSGSDPFTIQFSTGGGNSFAARSMGGTSTRLAYQLYTDALHTQIWGDGTAGTTIASGTFTFSGATSQDYPFTCYGLIPASQNVLVGSYADMISVLVTF
jgi:spore coat protein U-like protein